MQLYEILDCRKGDTGNAIKKSYCIKMKECRSSCSAYTINRAYKLLKDPDTRSAYDTFGDSSISLLTSIKYHFGFITLCNRSNLYNILFVIFLNLVGFTCSHFILLHKINLVINLLTAIYFMIFIPFNLNKIRKIGDTKELCKTFKIFAIIVFFYMVNISTICYFMRSPKIMISNFLLNVLMILFVFVTFLNRAITQKDKFDPRVHQVFLILIGVTQIAIVWNISICIVISLFLSRFPFKKAFIFSTYVSYLYILSLALGYCGYSWIIFSITLTIQTMIVYQLFFIIYEYIFRDLPKYYY
jgi:hypothetical protein